MPSRGRAGSWVSAALFEVRGPGHAHVRIIFHLPDEVRRRGTALDLAFDELSAGWSTAVDGDVIRFDPKRVLRLELSSRGRAYIWLGGTALPTTRQSTGRYRGQVTLTAIMD